MNSAVYTPHVPKVLSWKEGFVAGPEDVGGKAWNLSRLARYGFNVPPGIILPVEIYQEFLRESGLNTVIEQISNNITLNNILQDDASRQLQELQSRIYHGNFTKAFEEALMVSLQTAGLLDKPLAIRSSANCEDSEQASFAGIHESFLNVNAFEDIIQAIKNCYASLWSVTALSYRRKMGILDHQVQLAVILMEFINGDSAGVAFSCDPATGAENVYVINANFGLGESVVKGISEVDTYCIDSVTTKPLGQHLGTKTKITVPEEHQGVQTLAVEKREPVLSYDQQHKLGTLIRLVNDALSNGEQLQDIEWTCCNDQFYLLQSRPITAIPRFTLDKFKPYQDVWSNANFRDAVPMVLTTLMRDFTHQFVDQMMLRPFELVGYKIPPGLTISRYFNGRMYLNVSLYQFLLYDSIGISPSDVNLLMGGHQNNLKLLKTSFILGKDSFRRAKFLLTNIKLTNKYNKNKQQIFQMVDDYVAKVTSLDIAKLSDEALFALVDDNIHEFQDFGDKYMFLSAGSGALAYAVKLLKKQFGDEAHSLVNALSAGFGNITSADQGYQLLELAKISNSDPEAMQYFNTQELTPDNWQCLSKKSPFRCAFEKYLQQFGHRGIYEMDISRSRWRENPVYLLQNIKSMLSLNNKEQLHAQQISARSSAMHKLKKQIGFIKRQFILKMIQQGSNGSATREMAKSYSVKFVDIARKLYLEVGRRFYNLDLIGQVDDIFHCSHAEIGAVLLNKHSGAQLKILVEDRKVRLDLLSELSAPDVITENGLDDEPIPTGSSDNLLKGIPVSSGIVESTAKIVLSPEEGTKLQFGDIMIAPSTDPSWTPLFLKVRGIVLETGGYTSHASIVAREYGLPTVVNVPGILNKVRDKQVVRVDGNSGIVTIL